MNTQNKTDQIMFTKERTRIIYYRIRLNYKDAGKDTELIRNIKNNYS